MDEEKVVNQQRNEIKDDEQEKVREKGRHTVNRTGGGKGKQKV